MNIKQILLAGVAVLLVAVVGIFAVSGKKPKVEAPEPTPTPAYEEVDESVQANITPNAKKTAVTMEITGLAGRFTGIEYELNYQTDKGPKGTLSGVRPLPLTEGSDEFTREIELGTCSTGGKCTYDTGVRDFQLFIKLTQQDGSVKILRKTIDSI